MSDNCKKADFVFHLQDSLFLGICFLHVVFIILFLHVLVYVYIFVYMEKGAAYLVNWKLFLHFALKPVGKPIIRSKKVETLFHSNCFFFACLKPQTLYLVSNH